MRFPHARLLVFAKAPVPGYTKTRLIPTLGATGAAALHAKMISDTIAMTVQSGLAPAELWTSGPQEEGFFRELSARFDCSLKTQRGADLGECMEHALTTTLKTAPYAVLIGSDCPALDADYLTEACAALARGVDVVLGPAEDGGYVLIGARRSDPVLFRDISWGTAAVMAQTRARVRALGWQLQELGLQWDLDRPEDLDRILARDAALPPTDGI